MKYNTIVGRIPAERKENTMMYNAKTVTVKMQRIELCDVLLALTLVDCEARQADADNHKWSDLHDKLQSVLDAFDEAHKEEI